MKTLLRYSFVLIFAFFSFQAHAQFISGFSKVEVVSGLLNPTAMTFAPDGRIFICQQNGALIVIKNGVKLATPALQLSVNTSGERGLVGITLHPSFATNNIIYLYYTLADGSRNRMSRFTMSGDVINPATEQVMLDLDRLTSSPYHNGGAMQFLGDKLFVAVGDNSSGTNAQNLETTKGKILRLNANGTPPGDNPFYSSTASRQRNSVWAYGLRNPFTFDIQPGTGRIFINDVGQEGWEEVNDATVKGKNFGWPSTEGMTTNSAFTSPFYAYSHGSGDGVGCAITGGAFFNPTVTNYPASFIGTYFFLDYCNSWINYIDFSSGTPVRRPFATAQPGQMLAMEVGPDGNLYFMSRAGRLYKVIYNISQPPVITDHPDNITVAPGQTATFTVGATGANPLSFQWKKNGTNITGATGATYSIVNVQAANAGNYSVVVSNSFGSATSTSATLSVSSANTPPVATISLPVSGSTYRAGDVISFSGNATDPEQGTLPASAFNWTIEFHHGTHFHDSPPIATGTKTGTYTIPVIGETAINVFYRLILTVTDAQGLSHSTFVDLLPNLSVISLHSNPPGLGLTIDGQPVTGPSAIKSVEGVQRAIGVTNSQTVNGISYSFTGWAHGGTDSQTISTPIDNTTYVANFSNPLTPPWRTTDIGRLNVFGNASMDATTFTLSASGRDIYNADDHFRFVYQPVTGNCDIRARVTSITNTNAWAKAGVMIRETLQPNSKNVATIISPTSGTSFQRRIATGGLTTATNSTGTAPYWVRLVRNGDMMTSYVSSNGTSWTTVGSPLSVPMNSTVYVGLVVTSHSSNVLCTAMMTNVMLSAATSATSWAGDITIVSEDELNLYPNPNDGDILHVNVMKRAVSGRTIQLINAVGQVVLENKVSRTDSSDETYLVDLHNVQQGFYFVKVVNDGRVLTRPFIRK
jgi:glucose/arabinose dehydrogenase